MRHDKSFYNSNWIVKNSFTSQNGVDIQLRKWALCHIKSHQRGFSSLRNCTQYANFRRVELDARLVGRFCRQNIHRLTILSEFLHFSSYAIHLSDENLNLSLRDSEIFCEYKSPNKSHANLLDFPLCEIQIFSFVLKDSNDFLFRSIQLLSSAAPSFAVLSSINLIDDLSLSTVILFLKVNSRVAVGGGSWNFRCTIKSLKAFCHWSLPKLLWNSSFSFFVSEESIFFEFIYDSNYFSALLRQLVLIKRERLGMFWNFMYIF